MSQPLLKWDEETFDPARYLASKNGSIRPAYTTSLGALFANDCMAVLPHIQDAVVDTVFADPPFNLGKEYGKNTDDRKSERAYIEWCYEWLMECTRILKPGGALFVYNLPKWNVLLGVLTSVPLLLQGRHL